MNDDRELDIFRWEPKGEDLVVTDVSDDDGWRQVKDTLVKNVGMGSILQSLEARKQHTVELDRIGVPRCRFIALPLRVSGADGSPVRAIALVD